MSSLPPEDNKLVVLARATRARTGADEGAALRDLDGRTYAAATVDLPSLKVSAVGVAVSMAVASGAQGIEAVVVLTEGEIASSDLDIVGEFGGQGVTVHRGTPAGTVEHTVRT
ncbi:MAG: cytidine deaminase [Marmoricola sp.]|nr:cytidine deaminase [Marmoricola sp.]